jgi:hypothetical protein
VGAALEPQHLVQDNGWNQQRTQENGQCDDIVSKRHNILHW